MSQDKLWWYLLTPALLLDEQLALQQQEQRRQPQVLCENEGQRGRTVVQLNPAAIAAGIQRGMPEVLAQTLAPTLQSRDYDPSRETTVLQRLAQWLHQDIAQIALYPPNGLLFEVAGLRRLYGDYLELEQRLHQRLRRLGVRYILTAGDSPLMARVFAQAGQSGVVASRSQRQQRLAQINIAQSLLPLVSQQRLQELGIATLGALLKLPEAELGARFGRAILAYLAELKGQLCPPQQWYQPPETFTERLDLLTEVSSWQQLLFPLRRLLQQLEAFLQSRQWSVTQLILCAYHRDKSQTQVTVAFALPLWRQRDMQQLVQLQLERHQLPSPALEIAVQAKTFSAREAQHQSWVAEPHTEKYAQHDLQALLGKLQSRLGEQAIRQAQAQADWRPEAAQLWQPQLSTEAAPADLVRPLWLLPEAQPITLDNWQLQWGPERIQTAWWDAEAVGRDYFIALDAQQRQGWVFQSQQQWYLHGWFS